MTMTAQLERVNERVLERIAELKHVLQHVQSADLRHTVEAAIADIEGRCDVSSDPAVSRPVLRTDDRQSGGLAVE